MKRIHRLRTATAAAFLAVVLAVGLAACSATPEEGAVETEPATSDTRADASHRVILITLDGLRWEELFTGADAWLLASDYTSEEALMRERYDAPTPEERRARLMPFMWSTVAMEGQLYGNRHLDSRADLRSTQVFSYPGYNTILTGAIDSTITSNDKVLNSNTTVLEWVNGLPAFEGRVAAVGSWDVFPYILNEARAGFPVNAGFEPWEPPRSDSERLVNDLQRQIPSPWRTVRLDAFTHFYALETLRRDRPRLLYIAYGETDDFAHDGDYDQYLDAAYRTDGFIADLWAWVQADPEYAGRTTFIVTTDHGRGSEHRWIGHGLDWIGSNAIWMAAIGPDVPALGENTPGQVHQTQVAATVAAALGLDWVTASTAYDSQGEAGEPVPAMLSAH
jgi:hypothetical protein